MTAADKEILLEFVLVHNYGFTVDRKYDCGDECVICSDNLYGSYVLKSPCGHLLHRDCMLQNIIHRGKCCECTYNYRKQCKEDNQYLQIIQGGQPIVYKTKKRSHLAINDDYLDEVFDEYDYRMYEL